MGVSYPSSLLLFLLSSLLLLSLSPLPVLSIATVKQLPGFPGPLPFHLETGYVVVDEVNDSQLFYYFVKSERNPTKDPLILWLTGGPGCSALSGLGFEIGPFDFEIIEYNGSLPTLIPRQYSWTKIANIIFLDSPVGTGFSFSRKPEGYVGGDTIYSQHVYLFLRKWFIDHHEFLSNPLYIAGDSQAGKMAPIITNVLAKGIQAGDHPLLNLQGYIIGNPASDRALTTKAAVSYARGLGIISDEFYKSITKTCEGDNYGNPIGADCAQKLQKFDDLKYVIKRAHVLERRCDDVTILWRNSYIQNGIRGRRYMQESLRSLQQSITLPDLSCREYGYYLCQEWTNFEITRKALHIQKGTKEEWIRCNMTLPYTEDITNAIDYFSFLAEKGYRALVYSGDHDMVASFIGTDEAIRSFKWSIIDDWRPWIVDGQTAGFTTTYSSNLTFATVRGAGHTAPEYKPKESFAMFSRWIAEEPL